MKKNVSIKQKMFFLLAAIWFVITFSVIQSTYAKYVTHIGANVNFGISYWNINVNTQNILENSNLTNKITLVFPGNDYAISGVAVPNSTGYFDINIDSSEVRLPFIVELSTSLNEQSSLKKDFVLTGYSVDGGSTVHNFENNETSFSHNILKDINSTTIRVYMTWLEDGSPSTEETSLALSNGKVILDVDLKFNQTT